MAVGTTNGYLGDNCVNGGGAAPKPWNNSDPWAVAMEKFYDDRHNWLETWNGENASLQVDYMRIYRFVGEQGPVSFCANLSDLLSFLVSSLQGYGKPVVVVCV